ncbi:MAG: hypothetical protein LBH25_09190 [Fibromonadaceae bacterium]|jgi:hypothetical protein|nr:hypothetical protein [Fibromonadaceae bacterium]
MANGKTISELDEISFDEAARQNAQLPVASGDRNYRVSTSDFASVPALGNKQNIYAETTAAVDLNTLHQTYPNGTILLKGTLSNSPLSSWAWCMISTTGSGSSLRVRQALWKDDQATNAWVRIGTNNGGSMAWTQARAAFVSGTSSQFVKGDGSLGNIGDPPLNKKEPGLNASAQQYERGIRAYYFRSNLAGGGGKSFIYFDSNRGDITQWLGVGHTISVGASQEYAGTVSGQYSATLFDYSSAEALLFGTPSYKRISWPGMGIYTANNTTTFTNTKVAYNLIHLGSGFFGQTCV